ncbi:hypothetical protein [Streptomyces sp. NPDC008121]|uniref:hypothetical protein n=1 Tax=Streptomyces sp. NPDC008121 TaxID=3364809 RepID=UPI0036E001A5
MSQQVPPSGWGQPPGWAEPTQPPKRNTGKVIGLSCLGAIVLVVAILAIGGRGDEPDQTPASPATTRSAERERPQDETGARGDVQITACQVDFLTKWPSATLLITNRSSKASDYVVEIEFVDASNKRLAEAGAGSNGLAPGQRLTVTAHGLTQVLTKITCRVIEVTRYAS